MAIGAPYPVGSATSIAAASTLVINVGTLAGAGTAQSSNPGDCLVLFASVNSVAETITSVADSQGNTWTKLSTVSGTEYDSACFTTPNAAALASGVDTVTVTYSSSSANGKNAACIGVPLALLASPSDSAGNVNAFSASSNAPSATTGALAGAGEMVLAWCDNGGIVGAGITWGNSFTPVIAPWEAAGSGNQWSGLGYYLAPSAAAVTASGTLPTAGKWTVLTCTLKPAFILSGILSNTLAEGTAGTTITTSNSAGTGQNAFDEIDGTGGGGTVAYDTAYATDSTLSAKIATAAGGSLASMRWSVSMGSQPSPVYARAYLGLNAYSSVLNRLISYQTARGINCATAHINTNGTVNIRNAAGSAVLTSATVVPLGRVWRLEIFITGGATTGQCGFRLFTSNAENATPDETQTSAATQAFTGVPAEYDFGISVSTASGGPYWMSRPALSTLGWIGPAGAVASSSLLIASFP